MKPYSFLGALMLSTVLCVHHTAHAADVVSIRADHWFPMNGDPGSEAPGYMIELAQVILAHHGYRVDYQLLPWKRSLRYVTQGEEDCVVGAYRDESPGLMFPSIPWGIDRVHFYVAKGSTWRYEGMESLHGITLGIIGGYSYQKDLNQLIKDPSYKDHIQIANSANALEQNIRKLQRRRINATVESMYVMSAKLRELGLEGEIISAGTLSPGEPMYIACSPLRETSKQYLQWFDEGIQRLRLNGELQKILSRYGLTDWKTRAE